MQAEEKTLLKTSRITSQKKIIMDYLLSVKSHPTAEDVYYKVKSRLPQISLGTVYRVLNNLSQKDKAQTILSKRAAHFDADITPHTHFVCQECDKVFDIFDECYKCGILEKKKTKVGKIKNYKIIFYGICKNCGR
jgi:Fur family transcriptional regulator, peroxide stress response regulator